MENKNVTQKSGFAVAGLVLGIIGIIFSFIPIINNIAFFLGVLSVIFGLIPILKKKSVGFAVTAIILGILSVVITIIMQKATLKVIDDAINTLDSELAIITGENTDEVLKNYVDVEIGKFSVESSAFIDETKLEVTLKNKSDEKKSFSIEIEALDKDGKRIDIDYIYANSLGAKQSQDFEIFTLIDSEKIDDFKNATFRVVEASMY